MLYGYPEPGQAALPTVDEAYANITSEKESVELEKMHKEIISEVYIELQSQGYTGNINDEENTSKDFISDETEKTNDESSSTKKLSDLRLSESEIEQIVIEAVEKAERDTPIREMRSTGQATYQARHYRRNYNPESAKRTRQALILEKVVTKVTKDLGYVYHIFDTFFS